MLLNRKQRKTFNLNSNFMKWLWWIITTPTKIFWINTTRTVTSRLVFLEKLDKQLIVACLLSHQEHPAIRPNLISWKSTKRLRLTIQNALLIIVQSAQCSLLIIVKYVMMDIILIRNQESATLGNFFSDSLKAHIFSLVAIGSSITKIIQMIPITVFYSALMTATKSMDRSHSN